MLNLILALKFAHMIAMAAMFGTWLGIALFMLFAHRSGNTSVVALTSVFVVRAEMWVMVGAVVLQPLIGFPLALAVGSSLSAYWIEGSVAIYAAVVLIWIGGLLIEMRVRRLSKDAALAKAPLPPSYRRLFWLWSVLTTAGLAGMIAIMALMVWQPEWS
ncbi:MAG: DUF2269 domain-containing protein [Xanthobacteraceae bacterium]